MSYSEDLKELERQEALAYPPKLIRPTAPALPDRLRDFKEPEGCERWEPSAV